MSVAPKHTLFHVNHSSTPYHTRTLQNRVDIWDYINIEIQSKFLASGSVVGRLQQQHGPLARYVKFWFAQAPGMSGTFYPPPRVSYPDMHHGACVTHVPWCMPGLLTSGFLWSPWRGKRSRHSRRMHSPQFYVSGKRPMPIPSSHHHRVPFWTIMIKLYTKQYQFVQQMHANCVN